MHKSKRNSVARVSTDRRLRALLACSVSASACLFGFQSTAFAQDATASDGGIGEIVVTAQKREQNLQDVPVAVTAVGAETLQANRVTNIMDLSGLAPGLSSRQNAGSTGAPSYNLRGVFASASVASQDREVASYIDGVYLGGSRGAVFDLPDLERIEVLRGPQGTLFGRNATAGAVSIVTRDPTGKLGFRQEVTVGNYAQLRTRSTFEFPQMGILSGYVTYMHDERRGDTRNLGAGATFDRTAAVTGIGVTKSPEWLGGKNAENVFVALKLQPSDDFSLTYKFDHSSNNNTPEARAVRVINPNDFTGGMLTGILAAQTPGGGVYGLATTLNPSDQRPDAVNNAWTMPGYVRASGHNLTMKWQATDSLSFKNVAAYRQQSALGITSIAGLDGLEYTAAAKAFFTAPRAFLGGASYAQVLLINGASTGGLPVGSYFTGYEGNSSGKYWQVSDELQANFHSKFMELTVGGIWFHSHELSIGLPNMAPNFGFAPVPSVLPLGNVQETVQDTTSIAAYAQGEFHITPRLDIVLGARVTHDKKDNLFTFGGTYSAALNSLSGARVTATPYRQTKPTFSAGLNYKINDDALVYGKFSTAYLSGGTAGPLSFAAETARSWEIGLKSEWFDRHLRFNLALYTMRYDHSQASVGGSSVSDPACGSTGLPVSCAPFGVVVVDNGSKDAKGLELEVVAVPFTGMTVGGTLGLVDVDLLNPSTQLVPPLTLGIPTPFHAGGIPKSTASLNAQYITQPIVGDARMLFRIDGLWQGPYFEGTDGANQINPANASLLPYDINPGRWLVNARVALKDINIGPATGEIAVWARNLFDNKDPLYSFGFAKILSTSSYQPARTFGVDVILKFGGN